MVPATSSTPPWAGRTSRCSSQPTPLRAAPGPAPARAHRRPRLRPGRRRLRRQAGPSRSSRECARPTPTNQACRQCGGAGPGDGRAERSRRCSAVRTGRCRGWDPVGGRPYRDPLARSGNRTSTELDGRRIAPPRNHWPPRCWKGRWRKSSRDVLSVGRSRKLPLVDAVGEVLERGSYAALTQDAGNLSGNPGADTRHHRTASDEIGPAPEQPGWVWTGPAGRLGTDS